MKGGESPSVTTEPRTDAGLKDEGTVERPKVPRLQCLYRWLIGGDGEFVGGDLEEFFLQEVKSDGLLFA